MPASFNSFASAASNPITVWLVSQHGAQSCHGIHSTSKRMRPDVLSSICKTVPCAGVLRMLCQSQAIIYRVWNQTRPQGILSWLLTTCIIVITAISRGLCTCPPGTATLLHKALGEWGKPCPPVRRLWYMGKNQQQNGSLAKDRMRASIYRQVPGQLKDCRGKI